jgi:NAD(P)-dependent dehydrogenase (short-subunit alcohol dehydrogenase family)
MGSLDGRVVIITGAGRGLGREHALLLGAVGARLVVNDLDAAEAEATVEAVRASGGEAEVNVDDCADWDGGGRLIGTALDRYGRLDVVVNNAGMIKDRAVVNMTAEEWDEVVRVNLRGHFVPTRWAAAHWRDEHHAGRDVLASVVHTSSTSGLYGNPGQGNYGAAKSGIAAFSIICAHELSRFGVRSNCIVPAARTRLTENAPGLGELVAAPEDGRFDLWDPAHVSPVVAFLATADCPLNGATLFVQGGTVRFMEPWRVGDGLEKDARWTIEDLSAELGALGVGLPDG